MSPPSISLRSPVPVSMLRLVMSWRQIRSELSCDGLPTHPDHQLHLLADPGGHGALVDVGAGWHAVPGCPQSHSKELCSVQLVSIDWVLPASSISWVCYVSTLSTLLIGWRNYPWPLIGCLTLVNRQGKPGQPECDVLYCEVREGDK